jgi:uncharacterized protein YjcR
MANQYRTISKEIKEEIKGKIKTEGAKVKDLAELYGISPRTIYDWLNKDLTEKEFSYREVQKLRKENKELKLIIGEITHELSQGKKN